MLDPCVIKRVVLNGRHRSTGSTRHYRDGALLPPPHELRIVQYDSDSGCYLIHFDSQGEEMTDTCHDSILDAMRQAEFEFGVEACDWDDGA